MENAANPILDNAIDEVIKETPSAQENPRDLIERVTNKFIADKINNFPVICDEARKINAMKKKILEQTSNKGKYTDSYGWSESGELMEEYDIPPDLYYFMTTFVNKDFWSNENSKIWRPFMKKVCRGMIAYDAMNLFVKLKNYFGDTNLVKVK